MAKAQFVSEDNNADEDVGVEVIEVAGVIKWFDVAKGFGFVVPDEPGLPDVLLHVTCLRRDGFQTAYEGSRVVCEAVRRQKGLQAMRVLSMDESTAHSSFAAAPVSYPRPGHRIERSRAGGGEVVQPCSRVWLSDAR